MNRAEMPSDGVATFPTVIRIEPSGACNLRCSHCPTGTIAMKRGLMTDEIFARIMHDLTPHQGALRVAVLYHGGEPLLNKRLPAMIEALRALGIPFIKTVSNGMLLTEEVAGSLLAAGLDAIEFSLDGLSATENNAIRRNSDYATVVHHIKRLLDLRRESRASKPAVYVATTQFIHNAADALLPPEPPAHLRAEFSGDYDGEVEFKCTWAMEWPHMEVDQTLYHVLQIPEPPPLSNYCDHLVNTITIRWTGDVVPCCYDLTSRIVLGNIMNEDLTSIWNSPRYRNLRESIRTRTPNTPCSTCNVIRPKVYLIKNDVAEAPTS